MLPNAVLHRVLRVSSERANGRLKSSHIDDSNNERRILVERVVCPQHCLRTRLPFRCTWYRSQRTTDDCKAGSRKHTATSTIEQVGIRARHGHKSTGPRMEYQMHASGAWNATYIQGPLHGRVPDPLTRHASIGLRRQGPSYRTSPHRRWYLCLLPSTGLTDHRLAWLQHTKGDYTSSTAPRVTE